MEGYWVLILFLKIGVFFFLWRFLPPPFLTAKYSFLNTAIFCSGNSTGEFSVGFLSLLCLECFFSFSCPFSFLSCLADSQRTACTLSQRSFSALGACSLRHAAIKHSTHQAIQCVSALVRAAGNTFKIPISRVGSRLTSSLRKIFPFLPSLFSLPKEQCSKQNFWDAQFPL